MQSRSLAPCLAALALSPLASAQHRSPPPPIFAELRKSLPDLPWVSATGLADFDGDGDLDALIATHPPTWLPPELLLFENDGHASFRRSASIYALGKDPGLPWPQSVYEYYPDVTDIAVADVDGDGDEDCLLTLLYPGELLLLPNLGAPASQGILFAYETDLRLEEYAYPSRIVSADVDGDGDMDALLQVSRGRASIQLARNLGGGSFAATAELVEADAYSSDMDVADVDGDGNVDLLYVENRVHLLFGDGTGAFPTGMEFPNSYTSSFVTTGDIDGDGDADIVSDDGPPRAILNLGARMFVEARDRIPTVDRISGLELVDVDRDGDLDLALGTSLLLNDGTGFFSSQGVSYPAPSSPRFGERPESLLVGDMDRDGDPDFLLAGTNRMLLGDGAGNYLDTSPFARVDYGPGELADLDGDGDQDALVVGETYPAITWSLLSNDGRGEFERSDDAVPGVHSGGEAVFGDLDGDGDADALLEYAYQGFANDGHGRFSVLPSACLPAMQGFPLAVALGDLDGDGDLDAIQGRGSSSGPPRYEGGAYEPWYLGTWRNSGQGCFTDDSAQLAAVPDLGLGVALGDLDRDGDSDLVTSYGTLFSNEGNGIFVDASSRLAPLLLRGYEDVELGDLDGDGALDACFGGEIAWNDGAGGFPVVTTLSYYARHVALGDLNGDGRLDVVAGLLVRSYLRGPVISFAEMRVNEGARVFSPGSSPYTFPNTDRSEFALDDLDGDGDLDFFDGRWTFFNLELSLAYRAAPRIGHPLVLEIHGRARAPFVLLASRSLRPALSTPFGLWHLGPSANAGRRHGSLDAEGYAEVRFDVPRDTALIGFTLYWQALSGRPPELTGFERTTLTGF